MASPFAFAQSKKIPAGINETPKPGFWTILDGVLGGDTISEAKFKARAREASLADLQKQSQLNDRITAMLTGDVGPDGASSTPAQPPSNTGLSLNAEGANPSIPETPQITPKRRMPAGFDQMATPLAMMALNGNDRAAKVAEILAKNRPDLAIADDGTAYNKNDPALIGKRFGKPTVIGKTIKDLTDPNNLNMTVPEVGEGMELLYDAQGRPQVRAIPGYSGAAAQREGAVTGARKAAEAPFQMISVQLPDGSTEQMSLEEYRSMRGGGSGGGRGAPQGGLGRSQSPADASYAKVQADAAAKHFQDLQTAGQRAPTTIAKYRQLDGLLGDFEGGKLAPAGLELASALNGLGFKMDGKMSNVQAADALSKQIALDALGGSLGTAISNGDRDFIDRTQPGLKNSAAGRRTLVQMNIRGLERQSNVAAKARAWQQRFGRIDTPDASGKTFDDYLSAWAEKNPLFQPKAQ